MILHRITAIFAGVARDFTGQNHKQLADQYGIPLPLVFQTVATAHAIKKYSRLKHDRALVDIAVRISELTRKPDGSQALTTAQTMLIANLVRTGGAVDVSAAKPCTPWEKGRAEKQFDSFGFCIDSPVIGHKAEDSIEAYITASTRRNGKATATRDQALILFRIHQVAGSDLQASCAAHADQAGHCSLTPDQTAAERYPMSPPLSVPLPGSLSTTVQAPQPSPDAGRRTSHQAALFSHGRQLVLAAGFRLGWPVDLPGFLKLQGWWSRRRSNK